MKQSGKQSVYLFCLGILATVLISWPAIGQAVAPVRVPNPAGVSFGPQFRISMGDGILHYDLKASEMGETGASVVGGPGWASMTTLSGDLSYTTRSASRPFNLIYSGGYFTSSIPGETSTTYHSVIVSQGVVGRAAGFWASNIFTYLPTTPAVGLAGLPGTGDLGLQTGQPSTTPAPTPLTKFTTILTDTAMANGNVGLNYHTVLGGSASWTTMRYLSAAGLDNTNLQTTLGLSRRLNARATAGVNYAYSDFRYQSLQSFNFKTQGVNLSLQRQWSRTLSIDVSAGPQWIYGSDTKVVPPELNFSVNAGLSYTRGLRSATFRYMRGAMSGMGVLPGAFEDSVQGSLLQSYGRNWVLALTATYIRTSGLSASGSGSASQANAGNIDSAYASMQVTRKLGRDFSSYLSYTLEHQSLGQPLPAQNALNGLSQTIGAGVIFSPRSLHLGQL